MSQFADFVTCGLYHKQITIVNDDPSVVTKCNSKIIDDARVVIYYYNMFIIQVTDCITSLTKYENARLI